MTAPRLRLWCRCGCCRCRCCCCCCREPGGRCSCAHTQASGGLGSNSAKQRPSSPPAQQVSVSQIQPPSNVQRCYTGEYLPRMRLVACASRSSRISAGQPTNMACCRASGGRQRAQIQHAPVTMQQTQRQPHPAPGVHPKPPSKFLHAATYSAARCTSMAGRRSSSHSADSAQ